MGLQVTTFHGLDGLRQLEESWRSLAEPAGTPYYLDYDWYLAWVRHDPELPHGLHFIVVSDAGGVVIGIVPLQARVERVRRLPFRVWTLLGAVGGDVVPFASAADFLCRSGDDAPRVLAATVRHLVGTRPRRSLLQLGRMAEDSQAWRAARSLPRVHTYARGAHCGISTQERFDELHARLSRKTRANLRMFANRAGACGQLEFNVVQPGMQGFEDAYEDFKRVESSGWKAHLAAGGSLVTNRQDNQRRFVEALFRVRSGQLKPMIFRLMLGGECVAGLVACRRGETLAALKIGYEESRRRLGPGHLLIEHVLRYCCEDPLLSWVDMLSDAAWLQPWRPKVLTHQWAYVPLQARGQVATALLRWAVSARARPA
jgi:CelD/BcsL family acetyltransferase involved in cellulose biosynthesis